MVKPLIAISFTESAPTVMEYVRTHYLLTDGLGDIAIYERLETP
jgi:hypothetical protein